MAKNVNGYPKIETRTNLNGYKLRDIIVQGWLDWDSFKIESKSEFIKQIVYYTNLRQLKAVKPTQMVFDKNTEPIPIQQNSSIGSRDYKFNSNFYNKDKSQCSNVYDTNYLYLNQYFDDQIFSQKENCKNLIYTNSGKFKIFTTFQKFTDDFKVYRTLVDNDDQMKKGELSIPNDFTATDTDIQVTISPITTLKFDGTEWLTAVYNKMTGSPRDYLKITFIQNTPQVLSNSNFEVKTLDIYPKISKLEQIYFVNYIDVQSSFSDILFNYACVTQINAVDPNGSQFKIFRTYIDISTKEIKIDQIYTDEETKFNKGFSGFYDDYYYQLVVNDDQWQRATFKYWSTRNYNWKDNFEFKSQLKDTINLNLADNGVTSEYYFDNYTWDSKSHKNLFIFRFKHYKTGEIVEIRFDKGTEPKSIEEKEYFYSNWHRAKIENGELYIDSFSNAGIGFTLTKPQDLEQKQFILTMSDKDNTLDLDFGEFVTFIGSFTKNLIRNDKDQEFELIPEKSTSQYVQRPVEAFGDFIGYSPYIDSEKTKGLFGWSPVREGNFVNQNEQCQDTFESRMRLGNYCSSSCYVSVQDGQTEYVLASRFTANREGIFENWNIWKQKGGVETNIDLTPWNIQSSCCYSYKDFVMFYPDPLKPIKDPKITFLKHTPLTNNIGNYRIRQVGGKIARNILNSISKSGTSNTSYICKIKGIEAYKLYSTNSRGERPIRLNEYSAKIDFRNLYLTTENIENPSKSEETVITNDCQINVVDENFNFINYKTQQNFYWRENPNILEFTVTYKKTKFNNKQSISIPLDHIIDTSSVKGNGLNLGKISTKADKTDKSYAKIEPYDKQPFLKNQAVYNFIIQSKYPLSTNYQTGYSYPITKSSDPFTYFQSTTFQIQNSKTLQLENRKTVYDTKTASIFSKSEDQFCILVVPDVPYDTRYVTDQDIPKLLIFNDMGEGADTKAPEKLGMGFYNIVDMKTVEYPIDEKNPLNLKNDYFLTTDTQGDLKINSYICSKNKSANVNSKTLISNVLNFDYLSFVNKKNLYVVIAYFENVFPRELKFVSYKIVENQESSAFSTEEFKIEGIEDFVKPFKDYGNLLIGGYIKLNNPQKEQFLELIVDATDTKIQFEQANLSQTEIDEEKKILTLKLENISKNQFFKSSVSPIIYCTTTISHVACQQSIPYEYIEERETTSENYYTSNMGVFIYPKKLDTNKNTTIYAKTSADLRYGVIRYKQIIGSYNYSEDKLIHSDNVPGHYSIFDLNKELKIEIEEVPDPKKLDLQFYSIEEYVSQKASIQVDQYLEITSSFNWMLWGIVGLIVLLIILSIIFIISKKKIVEQEQTSDGDTYEKIAKYTSMDQQESGTDNYA